MAHNYKVMFVCIGNTCRSPMAEAGLRKLLENEGVDNVMVYSSGTSAATGFPATEYAVEAAKIWDARANSHLSQPLTEELIDRSDLILALASGHCQEIKRLRPEASEKTFLLKNYPNPGCSGDDVDDPIGGSLDMYNQTFIEIGEELGRILPLIIEQARKLKESGDDA